MATIQDVIDEEESKGGHAFCETFELLKDCPSYVTTLSAPLTNAGFHDFKWVGKGTNAFFVAPTDNDKIVFRISSEEQNRRNDLPFFLASGYETFTRSSLATMKLEVLLAGNKNLTESDKEFLLEQMQLAGWQPKKIENMKHFWKDVVMISLRDDHGRLRTIPIISDPSALSNHLYSSQPSESAKLHMCSSNYITLENQAAAYNALRESDSRLKKLIPEPVQFRETEVIPTETIAERRGGIK